MTFMCLLNWTDQGARDIKDGAKRAAASKELIERFGGRLLSAYVVTGQYDGVLLLEVPNGEAMTKFSIAVSAKGSVRTTTARAFAIEEFDKLVTEAL